MDRLEELLDNYGWANSVDSRKAALIAWMTEVTHRIHQLDQAGVNLEVRFDGLQSRLEVENG